MLGLWDSSLIGLGQDRQQHTAVHTGGVLAGGVLAGGVSAAVAVGVTDK